MQITVELPDKLYKQAIELVDSEMNPSELLEEALKTFVRVNSEMNLIKLGGAAPDIQNIPRRSI